MKAPLPLISHVIDFRHISWTEHQVVLFKGFFSHPPEECS